MIGLGFLYFFLPVFTALYLVSPKQIKSRLALLSGAGLICYADPVGLILMGVCILSGYLFGVFIHNFREKPAGRVLVGLSIAVNFAAFLLFHRTAYDGSDLLTVIGKQSILKNTALVGASLMPFHSIAYCVDVYRKKYVCDHKFIRVAEYIAFFPCFAAGPILRFDRVRREMEEPKVSAEKSAAGIRMLMLGLFMKLFISNTMYELWNDVRDIPVRSLPALSAWIGILAFAFFVFFELSAFSYMASGLASLMGIRVPRNFREPYRATGFFDFCRRFNCTVYRWCVDYIYRSIKRSGEGIFCDLLAVTISLIVAMLWYGFSLRTIVFGAAFMLMLCLEKILKKPLNKLPTPVRRLLFLFLLMVILPFLAFSSPMEAVQYIAAMFGGSNVAVDTTSEYLFGTYFLFVVICLLISSGVSGYIFKKKVFSNEYLQTVIQPVWVIALLIFCTAILVSGDSGSYMYIYMF